MFCKHGEYKAPVEGQLYQIIQVYIKRDILQLHKVLYSYYKDSRVEQ